jgi:fructokinase
MGDKKNQFVLVGLGEVLWDLLPGGKQLGGAPANFAYHASALGGCGEIASCVGEDDLGREILRRLDELGVGRSAVAIDGEHPTGTVSVKLDEHGKPEYTIHENVAWDFIPATPELLTLARQADAVCFGSLAQRSATSRETIARFLAATREECLRVFDINLRQAYFSPEVIDQSLEASDVLKLNDDELPAVARLLGLPAGNEDDQAVELRRRFELRLVVLTRGAKGSTVYAPEGVSLCPPQPVRVVDTVGAGDAFTAAIAMGLLAGDDLDAVHRRAARVAAYVCSQRGATPTMPEELKE